jgi:hypothetical protein
MGDGLALYAITFIDTKSVQSYKKLCFCGSTFSAEEKSLLG